MLHLTDEAGSTNDLLRAMAREGAPTLTAVLAGRQTDGRGRAGHRFFSPEGGLYMSVLLRPQLPPERRMLVTPLAAVAVCRALETRCGVRPEIKWVNDLLLGGRKLCGILCEGVGDAVLCGIGLNLRVPDSGWPDELRGIAAALPQDVGRVELAEAVLRELERLCAALPDEGFMDEYRARSAVLGRRVWVRDPAGDLPARALDIDRDGGLLVEYGDGRRELLRAGEISIRPVE